MADFTPLKESIRGRITQPSDGANYELEIKRFWNACLHSKRPLAFVKVRENRDVGKTVNFCVDNKLEISVCCGGTTMFALVDNAVVVDLSLMCDITVDDANKTALIEGGALVADVDKTLHDHGFVLPMGSFSKLGVAGMTLMGGIGFLTKSYGITSDSVLEYDLVTVKSDLIKVSAEENEELFWGMKGFGPNFGIVTSMKFKVFEMPDLVVGGTLFYPLSRAKEVIKAFRDYYEQRNDNCLSLQIKCFVLPIGPELLIRLHYNGVLTTGKEIVQDLVNITHPTKNTCKPVTHCEFQSQADDMVPSGRFYCGSPGVVLSELKDKVIENFVDTIQNVPVERRSITGTYVSIFVLSARSNAENRSDGTSSFPFHGNIRMWLGMNGATDREENLDTLNQWIANVQNNNAKYGLAPFAGGKPEEAQERLKQLKLKYDPENIFHNCWNVKT